VCALALAAGAQAQTLTVMTYNIGSGSPTIPLDAPVIAQIAQEIKDAGADVVGMQEVDIDSVQRDYRDIAGEISATLEGIDYPMTYYAVRMAQPPGDDPDSAAGMYQVLWSRYPILELTAFGTAADRMISRIVIALGPNTYVHCFVTHYYIGDDALYQLQTDRVLWYAQRYDGPRVLMGDFNCTPSSSYYAQIVASGFDDACIEAGPADCLTVGGPAGVASPPRLQQIDYVFGSPQVEFVDAYVPPTTVSDHWPIVATLSIPPLPAIEATPTSLREQVIVGGTVPAQVVTIEDCGEGTLSFTAEADADWLHASPSTGVATSAAQSLSITFDSAALPVGRYEATLTIRDANAGNSPQAIPVELVVTGVPGDFDGDRDVDLVDYGFFLYCFNGPGQPTRPNCEGADLDGDGDVDLADFGVFIGCYGGPNRPSVCALQS
jgi:endonuclease/exonuclease/phosphatase family metal-dependent hydrolase